MPLSEETLNEAADNVYGDGYKDKDKKEYDDGLKYPGLQNWEDYLIAGTSKRWVEIAIDEREGTVELLLEQFLSEYRRLK